MILFKVINGRFHKTVVDMTKSGKINRPKPAWKPHLVSLSNDEQKITKKVEIYASIPGLTSVYLIFIKVNEMTFKFELQFKSVTFYIKTCEQFVV